MTSKTIKTDIYKYTAAPVNTGVPSGFMDYKRHYRLLIEKALARVSCTEYSELHHILPKCMNGPDDPANLVRLTAREHFVAHWLLHRAYPNHSGLAVAFEMMATMKRAHQSRWTPSSRAVAEAREAAAPFRALAAAVPVRQYDENGLFLSEYKSLAEAARETGADSTAIGQCCIGKKYVHTAGGFQWRYASDEAPGSLKKDWGSKVVLQYSKAGQFIKSWNSIKEAQSFLKIHHISAAANGKRKSAGGFLWKFSASNNAFCGTQITNVVDNSTEMRKYNLELVSSLHEPNNTLFV